MLNLEIIRIYSPDVDGYPDDIHCFVVPLQVEIGETGKEGGETFNFVAASPSGLASEAEEGRYKLLRGYILLAEFDWNVIRSAVQNLLNHARSGANWHEVVSFLNRYGIYDSEDLDGQFLP